MTKGQLLIELTLIKLKLMKIKAHIIVKTKLLLHSIHYKIQLFLFTNCKYYKFNCRHIMDNHYGGMPEQCCYEQWCLQGFMCNDLKFRWDFKNHKNNA